MAWSSAELSSDEIALAAADKPCISSNALYAPGVTAGWDAGSASGTVASATDDATGYEAARVYDGLPGFLSKPDSASTVHSLVFDASSSPIEFDWFGVLHHNLDTLAASSVELEIADDAAFTTNLQTLTDIDVATDYTSDRRFADLSLFHTGSTALRYSAVAYIRIAITCSSGVPQIGQVVFGRRRQMRNSPRRPYDPTNEFSGMSDLEAIDGTLYRTARRLGQSKLSALFRQNSTADQTLITDFWADIEGGEQPFFYHETPNAAPDDFRMFNVTGPDPALAFPFTAHDLRDFQIEGVEQGPNFFALEG